MKIKLIVLALGYCFILLVYMSEMCWAVDAAAFVKKVEATPAWARLNEDELIKHAGIIEELGKDFQQLSLEEAKEIVTELQERAYSKKEPGEPLDSLSRIYVLLRFYFAVPEYEQNDKVKFFGGWGGIKERDKQFNILFPLDKNRDGSLGIRGAFQGYMGPGYNAAREMEYFDRTYGARVRP